MEAQTIVVIDLSVVVHQISETVAHDDIECMESFVKAQLAWMVSLEWLGTLKSDDASVVLVTDNKPYWRSAHLMDEAVWGAVNRTYRGKPVTSTPIHYKAGRKEPTPRLGMIRTLVHKTVGEQGWNQLGVTGFEADDVAAAICVMAPSDCRVILATVDSDWMGLISPRTMWFCLKGYEPRVRHSEESINGWATRRLKTALTHPSQLWDVKSTQGDKSDNLPAGSPLDVISLLEPPDQYKLWLNSDFQTRLSLVFDNPTRPIPAAKAIEYLQRQGFRAFIRYNDLLDDWQPWYPEPDLA